MMMEQIMKTVLERGKPELIGHWSPYFVIECSLKSGVACSEKQSDV